MNALAQGSMIKIWELSTRNGNGNVRDHLADYPGSPVLPDDSKSVGEDEDEKWPAAKLSNDELIRVIKRCELGQ